MPPVNRNQPRNARSSEASYTVMDFMRDFPDDATCLDYLWRRNFSADGLHAYCPKCERQRGFHRVQSRPSYSCDTCGHHLHPTAGTIFHKSSTSLQLWFHAIFLLSSTRCGISAKQLEREIGVTYKTAWRMFNRIRAMLMGDDDRTLDGDVEVDEAYVGGKQRHTYAGRPGKDSNKTAVLGMVERGGSVVAVVVPDAKATSLMPHIIKRVLPESLVYSDEWAAYRRLSRSGYEHRVINHSARVYVRGAVHTNTIEGFWSQLKRSLSGAHHRVSRKHLQGYLNEYAWRYNHRRDSDPMFLTLLGNVRVGVLV